MRQIPTAEKMPQDSDNTNHQGDSTESLFYRLFHAGSVERDRLEDFLTAIIADLLGRLPRIEQLLFCKDFLLQERTLNINEIGLFEQKSRNGLYGRLRSGLPFPVWTI